MMKDRKLAALSKAISEGKANYKTAATVAERVGNHSAKALKKVLKAEKIPEGKMTWEIAEKTVGRQARLQYDLINETAQEVQRALNKKAGLGLKSAVAEFDEENIREILGRLCSEDAVENVLWLLDDPIVHAAMNVVDNTIRANAELNQKAGMKPTVTRIAEYGACEWCADLAGVYDYSEVKNKGNEVWTRHNNCRCQILYDPGDARYGK